MSISSTVATLARALGDHVGHDPTLAARCAQLAEMPAFVARARLDLWESSVLPARASAAESPGHAAMVAILELGRINLYGDIDPELTREYLETALAALAAAGVDVPAAGYDVADW